ncbi:MAG: hypothetical protein AB7O62_20385, partial [Pirellulales bacterium]
MLSRCARRLGICLLCGLLPFCHAAPPVAAAETAVAIDTPMPPPEWALLQREVLRAHEKACQEFFARY